MPKDATGRGQLDDSYWKMASSTRVVGSRKVKIPRAFSRTRGRPSHGGIKKSTHSKVRRFMCGFVTGSTQNRQQRGDRGPSLARAMSSRVRGACACVCVQVQTGDVIRFSGARAGRVRAGVRDKKRVRCARSNVWGRQAAPTNPNFPRGFHVHVGAWH